MKKLFFLGFSLLSMHVFSQGGWELIYGSDSLLSIRDVYMIDTNHVWGACDSTIYFSSDWGKTWEDQITLDGYIYPDFQFFDSMTGWAVGAAVILKTEDGGVNWTEQTFPNPMGFGIDAVSFINPDTGWIAGDYRSIYVTYDGGENWNYQLEYQWAGKYFLDDIHFWDANHGCAVGGGKDTANIPIILTTQDGGENWIEILPPYNDFLVKVQFLSDQLVWTCDSSGKLFRSYDGGFTWELVTDLFNVHPRDMLFFNNDVAIAGGSSHLALTSNAWEDYQFFELQYANAFLNFSFQDDSIGLAAGLGNMLRTIDGGYNWKRLNERFVGIGFFNPLNGWVIQEYLNRELMHSSDGGSSWEVVETGHDGILTRLSFPSSEVGYVISSEGELLKTEDAGDTWAIMELPFTALAFTDMQFLDENTGFICAYPDQLYKTVNGGLEWINVNIDTIASIRAIDFISEEEGWVINFQGTCGHTINGGATWTFENLPLDGLWEIDFVNSSIGIITSVRNRVFRSSNGGKNWEQLDLFLNSPKNIEFIDSLNGWMTDRKYVYYTSDAGLTWVAADSLESSNSSDEITDLFLLDSSMAWICTMDGRVFSYSGTVGITENIHEEGIAVYPNPVKDILNIELDNTNKEKVILKIFSIDGRLVGYYSLPTTANGRHILDISSLSNGLYILNFQGLNISETIKLVKN